MREKERAGSEGEDDCESESGRFIDVVSEIEVPDLSRGEVGRSGDVVWNLACRREETNVKRRLQLRGRAKVSS